MKELIIAKFDAKISSLFRTKIKRIKDANVLLIILLMLIEKIIFLNLTYLL